MKNFAETMLRIFLFSGLILHKLIWEIGKIRYSSPQPRVEYALLSPKRIIKTGKFLLLLFFLIQTLFLDVLPIRNAPHYIQTVGVVLFSLGLAMSLTGRIHLGKNWADVEDGCILPDQKLVTTGIYRLIRHPIYAGDVLLVAGMQLALRSWLFLIVIVLLLVVTRQAIAEEKMLSEAFPAYEEYRTRTKRFVPFIF